MPENGRWDLILRLNGIVGKFYFEAVGYRKID